MDRNILGVDIGGVIISKTNDQTDTSFFSDNYLRTTAVSGALEALGQLTSRRFGPDVHLVSKCGPRVQEKTLLWLDYHDFYALTGIEQSHVHFCRERHQKDRICRELGISHFVDDRLEVLGLLTKVRVRYLFQPSTREVQRFAHFLPHAVQVHTWEEILQKELSS